MIIFVVRSQNLSDSFSAPSLRLISFKRRLYLLYLCKINESWTGITH